MSSSSRLEISLSQMCANALQILLNSNGNFPPSRAQMLEKCVPEVWWRLSSVNCVLMIFLGPDLSHLRRCNIADTYWETLQLLLAASMFWHSGLDFQKYQSTARCKGRDTHRLFTHSRHLAVLCIRRFSMRNLFLASCAPKTEDSSSLNPYSHSAVFQLRYRSNWMPSYFQPVSSISPHDSTLPTLMTRSPRWWGFSADTAESFLPFLCENF